MARAESKHGDAQKLGEEVARLHPEKIGKLPNKQADYLGVPVDGTYKPAHYRYWNLALSLAKNTKANGESIRLFPLECFHPTADVAENVSCS